MEVLRPCNHPVEAGVYDQDERPDLERGMTVGRSMQLMALQRDLISGGA